MTTGGRHGIEVHVMRGGTSRGPVLLGADLPAAGPQRDSAVLRLVGDGPSLVDGLGGGSPTTAKIVLVHPADPGEDVDFSYQVGNIVIGAGRVDWSGTCGNMTATVPLFALERGLIAQDRRGAVRLRNLSTGGIIECDLSTQADHAPGRPACVRTAYLDPVGAVLGAMLPTGAASDVLEAGGRRVAASIIDISHPYLFLDHDEIVGDGDVGDPAIVAFIEAIRGEASYRLGQAPSAAAAMDASPAVPRVVLLHRQGAGDDVAITALSMGQVISSVPVTAALCLAGARTIAGTLPSLMTGTASASGDIVVSSSASTLTAGVELAGNGGIRSVSVSRTTRTIMAGRAWI